MEINYSKKLAEFSDDGKRRLTLYRAWHDDEWNIGKHAMVIGLNPSTANGEEDDPTIGFVTRVLNFNGFKSFTMTNLFTMITPHPEELLTDDSEYEAVGIWQYCSLNADAVVFAWGGFSKILSRDAIAKRMFPEALCFARLKNGAPRHPMYLKENTQLIKFNP